MKYPFPIKNYQDYMIVSDYYLDIGKENISRAIREYRYYDKRMHPFPLRSDRWAALGLFNSRSSITRSQRGKGNFSLTQSKEMQRTHSVTRSVSCDYTRNWSMFTVSQSS